MNVIRVERGELTHLFRAVANAPSALAPFYGMSRAIRTQTKLPARLRELVILTTACTLGNEYQIAEHTLMALREGLTREEVRDIMAGVYSRFSECERVAATFAKALSSGGDCSPETFADLERHFTPGNIVELTLTVGWYHLVAVVIRALDIDLEPGRLASRGGNE